MKTELQLLGRMYEDKQKEAISQRQNTISWNQKWKEASLKESSYEKEAKYWKEKLEGY